MSASRSSATPSSAAASTPRSGRPTAATQDPAAEAAEMRSNSSEVDPVTTKVLPRRSPPGRNGTSAWWRGRRCSALWVMGWTRPASVAWASPAIAPVPTMIKHARTDVRFRQAGLLGPAATVRGSSQGCRPEGWGSGLGFGCSSMRRQVTHESRTRSNPAGGSPAQREVPWCIGGGPATVRAERWSLHRGRTS
jgi:hypothetical protein